MMAVANDVRSRGQYEADVDDAGAGKRAPAVGKCTLTGRLRGWASDGEPGGSSFGYLSQGQGSGMPRTGAPGDDPFAAHLPQQAVMRKEHGGGGGIAADAAQRVGEAGGGGGGAPLPGDLRDKFERSLGADLGDVRVHTGAASASAAESVAARAYATGNDIHFAAGTYDPASAAGEQLLAHEVAHTVQQRGVAARPQPKLEVSSPGDAAEHDADRAAEAMVAGRPASVAAASAGTIARDPDKTRMPANQPGSGLDAGMFTVKGGEPNLGGTVTADKAGTKVRLIAPEISFSAEVTMPTPLGPGERIDVGPIQTMMSSQRVGIYREGGLPDGRIVAEQKTEMGEMRDAAGEIDEKGNLDQATVAPFFSNPTAFNATTSYAPIKFIDKPKAVFPGTVGRGKLTETKGQDSFVTSVTAKKDGALLHLKTFKWQLPWGLKLDDGVIQKDAKGNTTAQGLAKQDAAPAEGIAHNSADIPILKAAGATHMDFQTLEDAMACSAAELLRYLPASTANPASRGFIIAALKAKNPSFHITVTVDKKNSSWGKDSVEVRITGQSTATRPRVSAGDGDKVAVIVQLNEVFGDLNAINGNTVMTLEAQDRSLIDGKSHRVDWPFPFDSLKGGMNGKDGEYSIVATMNGG